MSLDADYIVDRRRLRRKLTFWRVFAVLIAVGAVITAAVIASSEDGVGAPGSAYIARVKIQGLIRGDAERVEALERLPPPPPHAGGGRIDRPGGPPARARQP